MQKRFNRRTAAQGLLALTFVVLGLWPVASAARSVRPAAPADVGWSLYSGDPGGMRYANAGAVSPANVSSLKLAWSFHTGVSGPGMSFESTPVVAGGRLFLTAPDDEVFALDATSGKLLWRAAPVLEPDAAVSRVNRGVVYGDGRVYLATLDARLIAFDAATGARDWSTQLIAAGHEYFESEAPLYDNGHVIVGVAGGEQEIRGFVVALDARTGKEQWRFHTIPAPQETGGATWPNDGTYLHGGGSVWMTPVVDPVRRLVYFGVGNPTPDFNGSPRPGLNLFTAAIVALHEDTGALDWYFQEVHHDLWDTDPASPPVLLSLRVAGAPTVPALIEASKTGWLYVLDRRTGKPLTPIMEKAAPRGPSWQHAWPTQPEPRSQPFVPQCPPAGLYAQEGCIFTPPSETPTLMAPGQLGGSAWSPVSYSPSTGLAYIAANDIPAIRATARDARAFSRAPRTLPNQVYSGALVGYDVARGKATWRTPLASGLAYGGSLVTSGGVVFSGESSGFFDAHDASSGKLLWQYATHAGADAAPSMYTIGGRTYIAIAVGGASILNSRRGDTLDVFTLP